MYLCDGIPKTDIILFVQLVEKFNWDEEESQRIIQNIHLKNILQISNNISEYTTKQNK